MAKKIKAPAELFKKVAELSRASVAQLQEKASQDQQIEKAAAHITQRLVRAGLVDASNGEAMTQDIQSGGVEKIAEVFDSTLDHVGELVEPNMGKSASDSNTSNAPRKSNDVWNEWFGTPAA